jgi:Fe-S cluster assembly protein SufD
MKAMMDSPLQAEEEIWPSAEALVESIQHTQGETAWRLDLRRDALTTYLALPIPATVDENWRRSSISQLDRLGFDLRAMKETRPQSQKPVTRSRAKEEESAGRLAIENGRVTREQLDDGLRNAGVVLAPMKQMNCELALPWLGKIVPSASGKFEALASIITEADIFVYIPKGIKLERPMRTLIGDDGLGASAGRLLVIVDEDASLSLVHENSSKATKHQAARMHLIEIVVRNGGLLNFAQIQQGNSRVWDFTHARAVVESDASLEWQYAALGDASGRTILEMDLTGEGAHGRLAGLSCAAQAQHVECVTLQRHAAPHTTSDLLYKSALLGSSRSLWRGMVRVEENAVGADGYQANRNLVLSEDAHAESLPGLEILADDIRCSHGATIGTIDPNEVFYMRTRGVPEGEVRRVLMAGFFEPIIARFPTEGLRKRLRLAVRGKMTTIKKGRAVLSFSHKRRNAGLAR